MKRWLEAAARYEAVAEAGIVSEKWRRPQYPSLSAFAESEDFPAALKLLAAVDKEIVLADEPSESQRRVLSRRTRNPSIAYQRIILDRDGFKLIYVFLGGPCTAVYASTGAWDDEIKPPQPLKAEEIVVLGQQVFGFSEFHVLDIILNTLDDLTAYAP